VEMGKDLDDAWRVFRSGRIDARDDAFRNYAEGDRAVHETVDWILRREACLASHFVDPVDSINRLAEISASALELVLLAVGEHLRDAFDHSSHDAHSAPPSMPASSESAATMERFANVILNALCACGTAGASSASAARANASRVGIAPRSVRSATTARHGLCATPPSARRTSR